MGKDKILVTGGCGFIGSEVVRQLLLKGYDIRIIDDLSKPESKWGEYASHVEYIKQDLSDSTNIASLFKNYDVCINLAAKIGGIGYFHKYPANILSDNNKIYSSTFEAAVKANMKRMVYVSSSMVFESTNIFPSKESDVTNIPPPKSAYGCSKLVGEWYCHAFFDQFGLPFTIIRPFNAYGINEHPGDEIGYAHVIPDLVKKILSKQHPLELLGDGNQTRCFTHVSDIADGLITAMEHPNGKNEDFNISNDEELTVLELAKILYEMCSPLDLPFDVKFVNSFTHDIARRVPSTEKAKQLLNWSSKYKIKDKLPEVVSWLKDYLAQ